MSQNIIVVGPQKAGKTYLMHHLTRSYFEPFRTDAPYKPTIGIDIVGINTLHNIKYVYYDSSGQDRFSKITQPYFEQSDVIMIVFDLSSQDFQDLNRWYERCKCSEKPTIIVGTKHDLVGEGDAELLMAAVKFAQERECPFYPTSSVDGMGIIELRNALQSLIPEEEIFERAIRKQEENKRREHKVKKKKHTRQSLRRLFCCIGGGYRTLVDEGEPAHQYPTDLGVSV